jgi:phenylacetate-coenzyme A ligase PaaK-like adenylate-forming protein
VSETGFDILSVTRENFEDKALEVFRHQYQNVAVYREYCNLLKRTPADVSVLADVPFLPVELFKTHTVLWQGKNAIQVFESSGTTGSISSKHYVSDINLYEQSFINCFERFYGRMNDYVILALLPSYLERGNSSLVYMVKQLIALTGKAHSGFFLKEYDKLFCLLSELKARKQKTILLGVTFALLDFAEAYTFSFPELIVMETGGMKGRREELTRSEVHERLYSAFGVKSIHSEYGMTELLSQGYSKGNGIFNTPPWMRVVLRDVSDPLAVNGELNTGAVNVIDLANVYSCSFIATGDVGKVHEDGSFEVLGRLDSAETRGCNLMVV